MWKLWHKLFGWDYIQWSIADSHQVSRIKRAPNGLAYFKKYGEIVSFPLKTSIPYQIIFLTCPPKKYRNQPTINENNRGDKDGK